MVKLTQDTRILEVDALRGFALFGVLLTNIFLFNAADKDFNQYYSSFTGTANEVAVLVTKYLFRGRFYPIFSFLFGLGLSYQFLKRSSLKSAPTKLFLRVFLLMGCGLLHYVLLWEGDILISYSLLGLLLLVFATYANKAILYVAILAFTLHSAYAFFALVAAPATPVPDTPLGADFYLSATYTDLLLYRAQNLLSSQADLAYTMFRIKILYFVFIGFYVGTKLYPLQRIRETNWGRILLLLIFARLSIAAASYLSSRMLPNDNELVRILSFISYVLTPAIYMTAFLSLAQFKVAYQPLKLFAAVGRLSLTNYIMQSLFLSFLFYGYGLGYYQKWQPYQYFLLAVVIYAVQIFFSKMWLKYNQYGPLEGLWRRLTYGNRAFVNEKAV